MELKVTVYNFFKVGDHFEYVNDGKLFILSTVMMDTMLAQYRLMGFRVLDGADVVSVSNAENEIENFLKKVSKKG